ncbi:MULTISPECIES: hypothetical protein [unclassified Polaromonas]|jgi:hypothetical protein|uniref:hypothetical protein n=1 Tax=unclassified Polaromonas TaxID=2638319 RepID=UPI0025E1047B|nr:MULTISPECIES: hypothetical protein [unclassified Polaromonas]HQR98119.1 hypothetical protein [Polaromonas sp.]HQS38825.1 hypothetical protein [Polaromonas sp.]HQS88079.1 hypothetical protein [Polaromonas sp.]
MSKKQKLTPWFPGGVKPVRDGVYEAEWDYEDSCIVYYNYFDGLHWHSGQIYLQDARPEYPRLPGRLGGHIPKSWRGLAVKP